MKRIVSSFLALVIALSLMPLTAGASPPSNPTFANSTFINIYDAYVDNCGIPGGELFTAMTMSCFNSNTISGYAVPYPSDIVVSGLTGTIASAKITLHDVYHSNLDGVRMYGYSSGSHTWFEILQYTNPASVSSPDISLSTDAVTALPSAGEITSNTYALPSATTQTLVGSDPNGTWSLHIEDDIADGGINGYIEGGWSIEFTLAVPDTTAPVVTVPSSVTVDATDANGTLVTYTAATAIDDVDGALTPSCSVPSGALFPMGATIVTCSVSDAALNQGSSTFTVTVADLTAPVVTQPTLAMTAGGARYGTLPVSMAWSGTDAVGVTGYHFQMQINNGQWKARYVPGTATSKLLWVHAGEVVRIRVRGVDAAGNLGVWKTSAPLATSVIEATSQAVTYSSVWKAGTIFNSIDGTTRKSSTADATATVEFQGTGISWVSARNSMRGMAEVSIDGVYIATVDLYRESSGAPNVVFTFDGLNPTSGHSLTIKVLGQHNNLSTGTAVVIDHFIIDGAPD